MNHLRGSVIRRIKRLGAGNLLDGHSFRCSETWLFSQSFMPKITYSSSIREYVSRIIANFF